MTAPTATFVNVEYRGAVAILRFCNPPLGMIDNKGAAQLGAALADVLADNHVRAVVVTGGSPDIFIRHADVGQIARAATALHEGHIPPESFLDAPFPRLGGLLDRAAKPVIAAINGICMGGGLEIALACTMRVAGDKVDKIGLPEVRIDIFPGSGGTQRLPRLIGWQRARLFALRGEVIDAADALLMGIVDEVAEDPLDRAVEIATAFTKRDAATIAAILNVTQSRDLASGLDEELLAFAGLLRDNPAVRERLAHFVSAGERLDMID